MKRRSFFTALAKAAAIVALAPQLAFRVKPIEIAAPKIDLDSFWYQTERWSACYSKGYIDILTDRATAAKIEQAMVRHYESQKA